MLGQKTSWLLALGLMIGCVGCFGGDDVRKASGIVKVDGKPVSGGTVKFYPVSGGRSASTVILDDGTFKLTYNKVGDGLPPGEYKVAVVSDIMENQRTTVDEETGDELVYGGRLIHIVPPVYNNIRTTPYRETVTDSSEPKEFVIDIPSK